jgi:hypothetical protein
VTERDARVSRATELIRAEYRDSPGLRLTQAQIQRLCRLDADACEAALGELVSAGALRRVPSGAYVRADAGNEVPSPEAAARLPRAFPRVE